MVAFQYIPRNLFYTGDTSLSVIVLLSTPHDAGTVQVTVELSNPVGDLMGVGTGVVLDVVPNTERFQLVNIRINRNFSSDVEYTIIAALGPVAAEADSDPWAVATETIVPLVQSTVGPQTFGVPTANTVELVIELPHQTAVAVALRSDQWERALREELLHGEISWGLNEDDIVGTGVIVSATGQVSIQLQLTNTVPGVADNIMALAEACNLCTILNDTVVCPHVIDSQPCPPHIACANPFTCTSGMICKPIPNNEFVDHRCVMAECGVDGCTDHGSETNAADTETSISAVNLAILIALLVACGCIAVIMGYKVYVLKKRPAARQSKFGGDGCIAATLDWDETDNIGGWTTTDQNRVTTALALGKYDDLPASRLEGALISTGSESDAESNLGSAISWAKESLHGSFDAAPTPGMSPTTNWQASMHSLPDSGEHQMPLTPHLSREKTLRDDDREYNTYELAVPHQQPGTRSSYHQGRQRRLSAPISTLGSLAEDLDPYTTIGSDAESFAASRVQQQHRQLTHLQGATEDFDPYTMIGSDAGSIVPRMSGGASMTRASHRSQTRVNQRSTTQGSLSTLQEGFYDNREFRTDPNRSSMQWQLSDEAGSEMSDSTFYNNSRGIDLGLSGNSRLQVATSSTGTEASPLYNNQPEVNLGRTGNSRLHVATSTMRSDRTYDQIRQLGNRLAASGDGRRMSRGGRRPSQLSDQRGTGLGRGALPDDERDSIYDSAGPGRELRMHRIESALSDASTDNIYDSASQMSLTQSNFGNPAIKSPTLRMRNNALSESKVDASAEAESTAKRMRSIRPDSVGAVEAASSDSELTYDLAERLFSPVEGVSNIACDL